MDLGNLPPVGDAWEGRLGSYPDIQALCADMKQLIAQLEAGAVAFHDWSQNDPAWQAYGEKLMNSVYPKLVADMDKLKSMVSGNYPIRIFVDGENLLQQFGQLKDLVARGGVTALTKDAIDALMPFVQTLQQDAS